MQTGLDPATLLEHREFVRAIARRLLRDEQMADDVVQETYLRAWQNGRGARAWLARVCRNLSIDRLRSESRRGRRERAAAKSERVPPTHELADRLARHRIVVDAVLALDEPFRETVLLRFYEDLPPREIATALGIPVATVKSRLRRAFELLRKHLAQTQGRSWCIALLPLVAMPNRAIAATVAGGLVMKKLAGALVVLALLGTGWVVVRSNRDSEPVRRTDEAQAVTERERRREATPKAEEPAEPTPAATTEPRASGRASTPVVEPSGTPDRAGLRIRVIDQSGRAMTDVSVGLTLLIDGVGTAGPRTKTDAAGQVSFDDLIAEQVIAAHAGVSDLTRSARVRLTDGQISELQFELPSGFAVRGAVRDVHTGPMQYVSVSLSRKLDDVFTDRAYGLTDKDGAYALDGIPPGTYRMELSGGPSSRTVTVTTDGGKPTTTRPPRRIQYHERDQGKFEVTAPGPNVKNIALGKLSIEGVVRDGGTGALLSGVAVNPNSPHWASTTTDTRGRFQLASMPPGDYSIALQKDGYVLKWVKGVEIRENEVTRVEFTLERGAALAILLRDVDGKPVTGEHWVRFETADAKGWTSNLIADAQGKAVTKVVPLGLLKVSVSGAGWTGAPVEIEIKPGQNEVVVPLKRNAGKGVRSLGGVVRDKKSGAAIEGVKLRIRAGMSRQAFTDKAGRFLFEDLHPGSHRMYVSCEGYADAWIKGVKIEKDSETKIEVELEPAAKIHLRVTDAAGGPVAGRIYFVYVGGDPPKGRGLELQLDEDGRASFARVPPGAYSVSVNVKGRGKGTLKTEIQPGENTLALQLSK